MRLGTLAAKNLLRNKTRTAMTIVCVVIALLTFLSLRTVITSWNSAVKYASKDRIGTRHKITMIMTLPMKYVQQIQDLPEVKDVTYANWFGGVHPTRKNDFFATIAVDPESFLRVYDEIDMPPEQREAWLGNKRGALIGDVIAKKFGWKVGDTIQLEGTIFPGTWEFEVSAIYTTTRRSVDRATLWFHWDYLNDSRMARFKDEIGWIMSRVDDPTQVAGVSKKIDAMFDVQDVQTITMSERAMNMSFLGMFVAILKVINIATLAILLIMMLIIGNTIAMGVRERTSEYGMLRAVGFLPRHIAQLILWEGLVVGLLGGAAGLLIGYPLVNDGIGRFVEEQMGGMFPYFEVDGATAVAAVTLAIVLALIGAALPAYRASKLDVVNALRRVD